MIQSLLNKYHNLSKPVKASFWFIVSSFLLKGISFITLPIFSRLLTPGEYGVVAVYTSWVSIISIITTLTIWGGVFNVGMVRYPRQRSELISSFQGLATTITLIFMALTILTLPYTMKFFGISKLLIICMYIEILVQIPFCLWATEQRYDYKYKAQVYVTIINSILNPVIGVIAVLNCPYKAEARIISALLIQVIIGAIFFIKNQYSGKKFFDLAFWKFGFLFNVVLIPHYLSTQILNQSDRVMINNICGSADAGIYSVAYTFAMLLTLITNGINSSYTPFIYKNLKINNTGSIHKSSFTVCGTVAVVVLLLICFIPDIYTLLLPVSYYPSLPVIPPVAASAYFLFLYSWFGSVEFYYKENTYITIASMIGAVLNIILNLIFIPIYGFMAAAYTTLFCYICFTAFHFIFMNKILKKNNVKDKIFAAKEIFLISLLICIISIIMVFLYDYTLIRWCIILFICFIILIKRNSLVKRLRGLKE